MAELTQEQRKKLRKAQQGELDAVLMYNALAKTVRLPRDRDVFTQLAAEEGGHAAVFKALTGEVLKPRRTKAIFLPILLRLLGRQKVYPLIADGEYKAVKKYQHVVGEFPQVTSVRDDEQRHGDTVLALLD